MDPKASSSGSDKSAGDKLPPMTLPVSKLFSAPSNYSARPLPSDQHLKDTEGYLPWSRVMCATLSRAGGSVLAVSTANLAIVPGVDYGANYDECDRMGRDLLILSIDKDINHLLDGKRTAQEYWNALKDHFAPSDVQSTMRLLSRLFSLSLSSTSVEDIDLFVKEYKEIRSQLADIKANLTDVQTSAHILSLLPEAFASLKTAINVQNKELPSPETLIKLLRNEAFQGETPSANLAKGSSSSSSAARKASPPNPCTYCGKMHWVWQCETPKALEDRKSRGKKSKGAGNRALAAAADPAALAQLATLLGDDYCGGPQEWLVPATMSKRSVDRFDLDSGASHTMSSQKSHFTTFTPCSPERVGGISGNLFATGVGTISLEADLEGGAKRAFNLTKCLFVPGISANLISVSALSRAGLSTSFASSAVVSDPKGSPVALGNLGKDGLYTFAGRIFKCASTPSPTARLAATLNDWHIRYNHLSVDTIQRQARKGLVTGLSICASPSGSCQGDCNVCRTAKASRLPFPVSESRKLARLGLVHMDLLEPGHTSLGGKHYGLSIIDDYSRKTWLFPLGRKSDTFGVFKIWLAHAENETGEKLKAVRSDNGSEFINKEFTLFLASRGVHYDKSVVYTPQQNGRAERPNRDLKERTIALLVESGLPRSFWAEAMLTVAYTKNRAHHRSIDDVPERLWRNGTPPDVAHLRAFGCRAWMTIPKQKRRGLEPKGLATIFVGYQPGVKGYRLWDPSSKKVVISRDVRFEENVFPAKDKIGGDRLDSAPPMVRPATSEPLADPSLTHIVPHKPGPEPPVPVVAGAQPKAVVPVPEPLPAPRAQRRVEFDLSDSSPSSPSSPSRSESPDPIDLLSDARSAPGGGASAPYDREESPDPLAMPATSSLDVGASDSETPPEIAAFIAAVETLQGDDDSFVLPTSDPRSWSEASRSANCAEWTAARDSEIEKLEKLNCWHAVDQASLPTGSKLLGSKFVFKSKRNKHGAVTSHKARLVVQGFAQREGVDFNETFAPVVKFTSIRCLLSLAARFGYHVEQADVDSAFPQAELEEGEVLHIRLPDGMRDLSAYQGKVLRLRKALYGLKQAGRVWNHKIHRSLAELGYARTRSDTCIYVCERSGIKTYIALYVDDLLFVGPDMSEIDRVKRALHAQFGIKDLGAAEFILGIQISRRSDGSIFLSQSSYLSDILARFDMSDCKPISTPMEAGLQLIASPDIAPKELVRRYLQAIGSLMYAMQGTRPELAYPVSYLARFSARPTNQHWAAILRILRYIKGTLDYGLRYTSASDSAAFVAYSDADWGACVNTSRSTMGYAFISGSGALSWSSKQQTRVTASSTEAEYLAESHASREGIYLSQLHSELGFPLPSPFTLYGDNQGANALTKDAKFHSRTKHLRLSEHLVRELVEQKVLRVEYISTTQMLADIFTKSLPGPLFTRHRAGLGVCSTVP